LAYLTAHTHGLAEEATRLGELLTASGIALPDMAQFKGAKLMQPPTPIIRTKDGSEKDQGVKEEDANVNWPLLTVPKSAFDGTIAETAEGMGRMGAEEFADASAGGAWDDDLDFDDEPGNAYETQTYMPPYISVFVYSFMSFVHLLCKHI
jgi:hypothetical protein